MARPGFVLEVDERTPPLIVHHGESFRLQKFPLGTEVIYPPDSLPGIGDVTGAIRHALLNPVGSDPLPELLASYRSRKHHHNVHTMLNSKSYMDPPHSALHDSTTRMGRMLAEHLKIFTIETTLNNDTFPSPFGFLNKREWEWSLKDQASFLAAKRANDKGPGRVRREVWRRVSAPYGVTGITAGETEAVHERTLAALHRQQLVEVNGQADILVVGLPYICPYNVNSIMNPILVQCLGLGYYFNMYVGKPVVRHGGVMILHHPVPWEFNSVHHPSYIDFFDEVLAETTDPAAI